MKKASLTLCRDFAFAPVDKRIYGSFAEHLGALIYNGIYEPGHPSADENGFRLDVLQAVKDLDPTVIRYPGGNYTSGYNWEDSVGPRDQRPAKLDYAWRVIEPNTFGFDEFYRWNERVGSELIMTLNTGTRGMDEARNFVEYCNFPGGSYYSDLRQKHGRKDPYNIRTWCIGNEMDGRWQMGHKTATEYGRLCAETANLLRMFDPTLELIACGDSGNVFSWYPEYDREVLMECYDYVDYIALHMYIHKEEWREPRDTFVKPEYDSDSFLASPITMNQHIDDIIALCDYMQAVKRSKHKMMISYDEWNVYCDRPREKPAPWGMEGADRNYNDYRMEEVLVFCGMLMAVMRHADRVKIAAQSLLVNAGASIAALEDGVLLNGIYYPFQQAIRYGRGKIMHQVQDSPQLVTRFFDQVDAIDSVSVYNEEAGEVVVFATNRTRDAVAYDLDLRDFGALTPLEHSTLHSDGDLDAMNTKENPYVLVPRAAEGLKTEGGRVSCVLPAYSWNMVRIGVK